MIRVMLNPDCRDPDSEPFMVATIEVRIQNARLLNVDGFTKAIVRDLEPLVLEKLAESLGIGNTLFVDV